MRESHTERLNASEILLGPAQHSVTDVTHRSGWRKPYKISQLQRITEYMSRNHLTRLFDALRAAALQHDDRPARAREARPRRGVPRRYRQRESPTGLELARVRAEHLGAAGNVLSGGC